MSQYKNVFTAKRWIREILIFLLSMLSFFFVTISFNDGNTEYDDEDEYYEVYDDEAGSEAGDYENYDIDDEEKPIVNYWFWGIALISVFPALIIFTIDSPSPTKVFFNHYDRVLTLEYRENSSYFGIDQEIAIEEFEYHNLAFAFDEQPSHSSLIIYNAYIGTRGQQVSKLLTEMRGMTWTFKWTKKDLDDIRGILVEQQIEEWEYPNPERSLSRKILSKYLSGS